eukprot:566442-Pelagomonas_calceolata.AAC.17
MLRDSPSAAVQLGYMLLQAQELGLPPWEQRVRPFASAISSSLGENDVDRAVSCFARAVVVVVVVIEEGRSQGTLDRMSMKLQGRLVGFKSVRKKERKKDLRLPFGRVH